MLWLFFHVEESDGFWRFERCAPDVIRYHCLGDIEPVMTVMNAITGKARDFNVMVVLGDL